MSVRSAAVYLRQSLDRDGNELAITRQWEDCAALCEHKGWQAVRYEDNDTSATSGKPRPGYARMLSDIAAGRVDAVVAWDLDRLHRRPIELESFMQLADKHAVALATATGDVNLSTDNGRLYARIKGAVAMAEVERKSERQKRAATQLAQSGRPWWPTRPFGFDADPGPDGHWSNKATVRPHATEADQLKAAYQAVLGGTSLGRIAADFNTAGITTPRGTRWRGSAVRALLLAARNAGLREHHGQIAAAGGWPAIIDEETWRSVVALLNDPRRGGRAPRGRKRLLSGIAICGVCGSRLGSGVTHASKTLTYVCKHCRKVSRGEAPIDAMVIEAVVARLSQPDAVELTRREAIDGDDLRTRRDGLRAQQADLGRVYADGQLSLAAFSAADTKLTESIAEIDTKLTDSAKAHTFDGVIGAADVDAAFDALDLGRKRAVIAALVTVTVKPAGRGRRFDPDTVHIVFRGTPALPHHRVRATAPGRPTNRGDTL